MSNEPTALRDDAFMAAFLDAVIPPSADGRMPGAGSLGLAPAVADAITDDGRFGPPVAAGLEAVRSAARERDGAGMAALSPEARREVIETTLVDHPELMRGVTAHLYLVYYQHPDVLAGLGEPPRPPFPGGFEVDPMDPALLAVLEARARS